MKLEPEGGNRERNANSQSSPASPDQTKQDPPSAPYGHELALSRQC